jgi:hypothetical protein
VTVGSASSLQSLSNKPTRSDLFDEVFGTPTAFANLSPGLLQPWIAFGDKNLTLKELANSCRDLANTSGVNFEGPLEPRVETTLG